MNPRVSLAKVEISGVAGTIPEGLLHFLRTQRAGVSAGRAATMPYHAPGLRFAAAQHP